MRNSALAGIGICLSTLVIGCGGDDAVVQDHINLVNDMAGIFEKVTDAQTFKNAEAQMKALEKRAEELAEKTKDWTDEKKKALAKKYESEMKTAADRLKKAVFQASKKAGILAPGFP